MPIAWLTVLKMVPWGDVIVNAPKIADGAMKLWSTVSRKPVTVSSSSDHVPPATSSETQSIDALKTQLITAEARISDLHNQMLESSELIKALADQSALLIKRIEINRIRVLWLSAVVGILLVIITINLVITLNN